MVGDAVALGNRLTQLHRAGEAVQDVARTYSQIDDGAAGVFAE